jgi:hypothetical protein
MIVMRFGPGALSRVRFAISPLIELMRSVEALGDPAGQALHLPWMAETRTRVDPAHLALLATLTIGGRGYAPDFVDPPPSTPLAEIDEEIEAVLATPPDIVRDEVARAYEGHALPAMLAPFVEDPAAALPVLGRALRGYWEAALAPHWPRIRAVLQGDILYRARQLADGGAELLFADMDPRISFSEGELRIEKRFSDRVDLEERGLLFVPSVFSEGWVCVFTDPRWQPTILYSARGVGMLWQERDPAPEALAALLGRRRAAVLAALDEPRSTTDLAGILQASPSAVSQHLAVLRDAGLVTSHRLGRLVLYLRTAAGEAVVGEPEAA